MPFQIARTHVRRPDAVELERLRAAFAANHCVKLPEVIDPAMLAWAQARLAKAAFVEHVHGDPQDGNIDSALADDALQGTLLAFINDSAVFETIQAITGCEAIANYWGKVNRLRPDSEHRYNWHDDCFGARIVAMSVNLGAEPYDGGVLEVREAPGRRVVAQLKSARPGDALLIQIAEDLEHRVTPVTGAHPRTCLAGWFQRTPPALLTFKKVAGALT